MTEHYIILSSSYTDGARICFDIIDSFNKAQEAIDKIKDKCGADVSLAFQAVTTESADWSSVRENDPFFADVLKIEFLDDFIAKINRDRELTAFDVTKYILSTVQCTHLKLQKLLYFCYADYLCATGSPLFNDKICALPYGPVVSAVCDFFKGTYKPLTIQDLDKQKLTSNPKLNMPARSKILFTRNGNRKLNSIDRTLYNYKTLDAFELVKLTHRDNTPWSITKQFGQRDISNEVIIAYHVNETI